MGEREKKENGGTKAEEREEHGEKCKREGRRNLRVYSRYKASSKAER